MRYPKRSRIKRISERKSRKNLIVSTLGIVIIIFAVFKIGIPILASASLFLSNLGSQDNENQEGTMFLQPPVIFSLPTATNSSLIKLEGQTTADREVEIFIGGDLISKIKADGEGKFEVSNFRLKEGENIIAARVKDNNGKQSEFSESQTVVLDNKPPELEVSNPSSGEKFSGNNLIDVRGKTEKDARITVNEFRAIVDPEGNFSYTLSLSPGENKIIVRATDLASNQAQTERIVTFSP